MTSGLKDWDSTAFVRTVQHFCKTTSKPTTFLQDSQQNYCIVPKKPIPNSKDAVLSQKRIKATQKTQFLEPVRPPGDLRPQRLRQYRVYAHFAEKGQYSTFASFLATMLYCPNLVVVCHQIDWDSTALLLVFLQKRCTVPLFFAK